MDRRHAVAGCIVSVVVLLLAAMPAEAAGADLNRLVDGPFTGSGTVGPDARCSGVPNGQFTVQNYTYGAGEPAAQSGTVHVEGCVQVTSPPFPVRGTFDLTSNTGATLSGVLVGTTTGDTFHSTLRVRTGTREFRNATGTIDASGTADTGGGLIRNISGNFVGSLVEAALRVNDTSVVEGDSGQSTMVFRVRLVPARTIPVEVRFIIADGSAKRTSDYVFKQGTLTFTPGQTSKQVGVKVNGDTLTESNETLFLLLYQAKGARIADGVGAGVIGNDD